MWEAQRVVNSIDIIVSLYLKPGEKKCIGVSSKTLKLDQTLDSFYFDNVEDSYTVAINMNFLLLSNYNNIHNQTDHSQQHRLTMQIIPRKRSW